MERLDYIRFVTPNPKLDFFSKLETPNPKPVFQSMTDKRSLFIGGLLLNLFLLTACSPDEKAPYIQGTWIVIDLQAPGISAMSQDEAESWIGKTAQYTNTKASFDGETCESPTYKRSAMQPEDLYDRFRVSPESLGYETGPIEVIEVYCGNTTWANAGGMLVRVGEGRVFTVWDGVFFHLKKSTN